MATGRMTVFVDASWCQGSRYGGWGAWAKRDGWGRGELFGGAFKTMFASSTLAELGAIANALVHAGRAGWLDDIELVMIQSDCMAALVAIRDGIAGTVDNAHSEGLNLGGSTSISDEEQGKMALFVIASVVEKVGVRLEVRHVKGHSNDGSTRSSVNRACDKLAKGHMRARRAVGNPETRARRRRAKRRAKAAKRQEAAETQS